MKFFPFIGLGVTNLCNNNCKCCVHFLKEEDKYYSMSLFKFKEWMDVTAKSDYYFHEAIIFGLGEPSMWPHLEEAVFELHHFENVGSITCYTNGWFLDRFANILKAGCLETLYINVYPNLPEEKRVHAKALAQMYSCITITEYTHFKEMYIPTTEAAIPCTCLCDGPVFNAGYVYPYCGKVISHKAATVPGMRYPLRVDYLDVLGDDYGSEVRGTLEACKICPSNSNFYPNGVPNQIPHVQLP